jgi:integrase/recombinase XerD
MVIDVIVEEGFKRWLVAMGYADSTVIGSVQKVWDFIQWLSKRGIGELSQVDGKTVRLYYEYLQKRKSKRNTGSLSVNYINGNINALKRFSRYLEETGRGILEIDLPVKPAETLSKAVLSKKEIRLMYQACSQGKDEYSQLLASRDRAILSIFYGCGLRRSEGLALNVQDVMLKEKLVIVRKGKNYRERYVPMAETVREDLTQYIRVARKKLLSYSGAKQEALLISRQAKRLSGNQLIGRIQHLATLAGIETKPGVHTLRHSIATHLLQSGMSLEEVSQFLGHASLESTQIYTHIANEQGN